MFLINNIDTWLYDNRFIFLIVYLVIVFLISLMLAFTRWKIYMSGELAGQKGKYADYVLLIDKNLFAKILIITIFTITIMVLHPFVFYYEYKNINKVKKEK